MYVLGYDDCLEGIDAIIDELEKLKLWRLTND